MLHWNSLYLPAVTLKIGVLTRGKRLGCEKRQMSLALLCADCCRECNYSKEACVWCSSLLKGGADATKFSLNTVTSSPEEWAKRGNNLMENGLEHLAVGCYLQVCMLLTATFMPCHGRSGFTSISALLCSGLQALLHLL